jgi:DNA-binding MarR family transcriptional regulator
MRKPRPYVDKMRKVAIMKDQSKEHRNEYFRVMQFADTLDSKLLKLLLKVLKDKANKEIAGELCYTEQTACRLLDKLEKEAEIYFGRQEGKEESL